MVWGRWVLRATWARDKKRKGEKNTRKERTFWKEQGEKGQRCKEQKTCPECQDQGWKARGSIEGEERQDKCNAISRVHQQKTQASLWESCWPKFWACEKKKAKTAKAEENQPPPPPPRPSRPLIKHGGKKDTMAIRKFYKQYKDDESITASKDMKDLLKGNLGVGNLTECRLNIYWRTPACGVTSKTHSKDIAHFNFNQDFTDENYMTKLAITLKCAEMFVTWAQEAMPNYRNCICGCNSVLLAFLSLRSKEWCFNMRSRFRFCPVWLPVFFPLCLGFYSGAWPEERGHHHGWYREGWWVFPVHARLPQRVSKACSRKVVVLLDLCFSNSWLGDFETECSDFATLLAVCLWVANT